MLIWFIEIPIVFFFVAGLAMIVLGKMVIDTVTGAFMAVGAVLLFASLILLFVTVVVQHIDEMKLRVCDKYMKLIACQGATLFAAGFLIRAIINTTAWV